MEKLFPILFCYVVPGLLALVGAWHLVNPVGIWRLGRLEAQSRGQATSDAPTPGALTVVRIRGWFFLLVAAAFAIFSQSFFRDFGS